MKIEGSIASGQRWTVAMRIESRIHGVQFRKGTTIPYIAHPMSVAARALRHGADDDVAIAALLHDTVEDGGGSALLWRIRWAFGWRVARIVEGCTDSYVQPKRPWEERKRAYVERLRGEPREIHLVVACDKLDNLKATNDDLRRQGARTFAKFSAPPARLGWYYTECVRAVRGSVPGRLAGRLDDELGQLMQWVPVGEQRRRDESRMAP